MREITESITRSGFIFLDSQQRRAHLPRGDHSEDSDDDGDTDETHAAGLGRGVEARLLLQDVVFRHLQGTETLPQPSLIAPTRSNSPCRTLGLQAVFGCALDFHVILGVFRVCTEQCVSGDCMMIFGYL